MQLVLSNNRIIAHGENFLSMGGVVINTETGAKYENATIAECNGACPSDINEVGYEYHAGVFVPCAPFGKGNNNGYFMEVCADCATPRNSGIPVRDLKWDKIASINCVVEDTRYEVKQNYTFPTTEDVLNEYSMLRYKIKAGSYIQAGTYYENIYGNPYSDHFMYVGGRLAIKHYVYGGNATKEEHNKLISFDNDLVLPIYLQQHGVLETEYGENAFLYDSFWYDVEGNTGSPLSLNLYIDYAGDEDDEYINKANLVVELEGRK